MTKEEFEEEITTWYELIDFCQENECYVLDEVVDAETLDELLRNEIRQMLSECEWTDIRSYLNDIESGAEYYGVDGYDRWVAIDDEFEYYKAEVCDWGAQNYVFEPLELNMGPEDNEEWKVEGPEQEPSPVSKTEAVEEAPDIFMFFFGDEE